MKIVNKRNRTVYCYRGKIASTFVDRLIGLMFAKEMKDYDGLLIDPCNSIHTFFMKFSIDVIFIDKKNRIVKVIKNILPWKITRIYFKASKVLELPGGTIKDDFKIGDELEVLCIK